MTVLVVFDFDETMIDGNIDLQLFDIIPSAETLPTAQGLRNWHDLEPVWTDYMRRVFTEIHSVGVTEEQVIKRIQKVSLIPEIMKIWRHLSTLKQDQVEVLVLSDANTLFISKVLEVQGLDKVANHVYSNPAWFDVNGQIRINHYHQHLSLIHI